MTMTTAPEGTGFSGTGPLAALLCKSEEHAIVDGLRRTARQLADSHVRVRLYVFDHAVDQQDVLSREVPCIVWDGHGNRSEAEIDSIPLKDLLGNDGKKIRTRALIVGCCWSGKEHFTDAFRNYLAEPVAYVGCLRRAGKTHGSILFPPLLRTLALLAPGTDIDTLKDGLEDTLKKTLAAHPRLKDARWEVQKLEPSASGS
jgi:hypothetical protein